MSHRSSAQCRSCPDLRSLRMFAETPERKTQSSGDARLATICFKPRSREVSSRSASISRDCSEVCVPITMQPCGSRSATGPSASSTVRSSNARSSTATRPWCIGCVNLVDDQKAATERTAPQMCMRHLKSREHRLIRGSDGDCRGQKPRRVFRRPSLRSGRRIVVPLDAPMAQRHRPSCALRSASRIASTRAIPEGSGTTAVPPGVRGGQTSLP